MGRMAICIRKAVQSDLARKMKILMEDPEKIRMLGKTAYERSVKLFTRKQNAEAIERVYREICREV